MDRRAQVITAVWRVILRAGIAGVSIRVVAAEAGVSVGLVQHHFPTKEVLIRRSAAAMIDGATARYLDLDASSPDAIRHLVAHVIPMSEAARGGVVVWHAYLAASVADEDLAILLRDAKRGQETALAGHLVAIGAAGEADASVLARSLIAAGDGLSARVVTGDLTGEDAMTSALDLVQQLAPEGAVRDAAARA